MSLNHGTPGAYNKGCRCAECREVNRVRMKVRREYLRSRRKLIKGRWTTTISIVVHGTTNGYENWQCRCIPCSEKHSADMAKYNDVRREKRRARKVSRGSGDDPRG